MPNHRKGFVVPDPFQEGQGRHGQVRSNQSDRSRLSLFGFRENQIIPYVILGKLFC
jgi:hypothetical protein